MPRKLTGAVFGEVPTGDFGPDDPSERELRRRGKIKEGTW